MDLYDLAGQQDLRNAAVIVNAPAGRLDPLGPLDLVRNGIEVSEPVIYALPKPGVAARLKAAYPARRIYACRRPLHAVSGRLDPLE